MVDLSLLLLAVTVLLAVVVGGLRMVRAAVLRGGDRRSVALDTDVGVDRRSWALERGWQYVSGPTPVPADGLEPPGFLAPVEATHVLLGAHDGRALVVSTRSGEYLGPATGERIDWRSQTVRLAHRRPALPLLLVLGGQDSSGPLPGLLRRRPDLTLVRSPLGLPWLLAAPSGREDAVTTALAHVLHADVPGGVVVQADGDSVVVAFPGQGTRAQVVRLLRLAEDVALALERVGVPGPAGQLDESA